MHQFDILNFQLSTISVAVLLARDLKGTIMNLTSKSQKPEDINYLHH